MKLHNRYAVVTLIVFLVALQFSCGSMSDFSVEEATISSIHDAFESGTLTSEQLVQMYLDRIEKYDQSTGLNSFVVLNPNAINRARELDEEFERTGKLRPLHGIPVVVKDNYDTHDLQTAAGSIALKGSLPPDDSYQVRKIREAGAIVIGKSNMAEWAFSPYLTESSIAGVTRNPYDLERVPAGSSGGTAAAVAANLGAIGLGTDTGNSIRGPSSHCALVGIRSTLGLTSRDGIVPLYLRNDVGGPMCRTVEDAVLVLEVIAGYDPADPVTKQSEGKIPENYTQFLKKDLTGIKIGIFREIFDTETVDKEIVALIDKAADDLRKLGAEVVDPFAIPGYQELRRGQWADIFQYDVNNYLASLGDNSPYKTLQEIYDSGKYSPYVKSRIERALKVDGPPEDRDPPRLDPFEDSRRITFREGIEKAMDEAGISVFIYPTWSNPPRKIGDMESPHGDNSQQIPPHTGMPGFSVPMGFTYGKYPAGMQIVGRIFDEPSVIHVAYAYEQATQRRKPPELFTEKK